MSKSRPVWGFKTPMDTARWLADNIVVRIEQESWHDGFGVNSDYWLNFYTSDHYGHKEESLKKVPTRLVDGSEIMLTPHGDNTGLVKVAAHLRQLMSEIDAWEKKNKRELATYKRLHKKYGNLEDINAD